MISTGNIHYVKCSIRNWKGEEARLKINMDMIGVSSNRVLPFQWKMTQEKRELKNSLGEDADWSGYATALQTWQDIRNSHGHAVKLWIGKLHDRVKFKHGQVQVADRIDYAVSILLLNRKTQQLSQYIWMEDWQYNAEFYDLENVDYNRIWDFRNPLSNKIGTTRSRRLSL
jgi:hypothetical protein